MINPLLIIDLLGLASSGNDRTVDYLLAGGFKDKLLNDGFAMHMETDGYIADKIVEYSITNGFDYVVEEIRLTSIMDEYSGAKIEAYSYYVATIMKRDEASSTITYHVQKNVLLVTNTVDEKEVVVGFISSGQAVDVRTGTFYEGRTPHAMSYIDIAGSYIGDYEIK